MKKIAEQQFVGEYQIDPKICDRLIELHKATSVETDPSKMNSEEEPMLFTKRHGITGGGVDKNIKASMDLGISPDFRNNSKIVPEKWRYVIPIATDYMNALDECLNQYAKELDYFGFLGPCLPTFFGHLKISSWLVQHYKPGEGYYQYHAERMWGGNLGREYTFMTYLNDVPNGGTEFYYQEKTYEAKKGKTLIWPAHYTHIHRGQITNEHEKYIATGWVIHPPMKQQIVNRFDYGVFEDQ